MIPQLATEWSASEDGLDWTFELQTGVTFHDGEPFNAAAVCFNFDRWYNFTGPLQLNSGAYYWRVIFGGFAANEPDSDTPETSLYESCEAVDDDTVVLHLTAPSAAFLSGLVLPPFSIASPEALTEFEADSATLDADGNPVPQGTFGTEHPVGTGPFKFEAWIRNDRLTLVAQRRVLGRAGVARQVIFRPIPDNAARLQALQTGEIDGYDLVDPLDVETIAADSELQLIERPSFNVGYVGFNADVRPTGQPGGPPGHRPRAESPGGDRQHLRRLREVPLELHATVGARLDRRRDAYDYDPEKARALLEESGLELPVQIDFWYPSGRVTAVHARSAAHRRGLRFGPRTGRLRRQPEVGAVDPRLPRRDVERRCGDPPARADRRLR